MSARKTLPVLLMMSALVAMSVAFAACGDTASSQRDTVGGDTSDSSGDTGGDGSDLDTSDPDVGDDADADTSEDQVDPLADGDGDGITDVEEGRFDPNGPVDTDDDGTPDYMDDDSDNDGLSDAIEGAMDGDGDGLGNFRDTDSDGDNLTDAYEGAGGVPDTDMNGIPDYLDVDSDGDGIRDNVEGIPSAMDGSAADSDGDGIPDFRDADTDNDSLTDLEEGVLDWDNDGIPNYRDPLNDGVAPPITLVAISTAFNNPIGIDFHEPTSSVVMSVNYPTGNPLTLERIEFDGTHQPFSTLTGLTDEVKIATARSGNPGGFVSGDLFVGNGLDGEIVRITDGGQTIINPWVSLPNANNGLMRGSLYVDRTGVWAGDLVVCTTLGELWRIDAAGTPTFVASAPGVHLEGLITVPDAPARYGPLAGTAIAGAEGQGLLYAFKTDGTFETYNLGVLVEDIDIVSPNENFFGVNYGTGRLLGAQASDFESIVGDVILTQESHTSVGLYRLRWDGMTLSAEELTVTMGSAAIGQWEHVTFAAAGIVEIIN